MEMNSRATRVSADGCMVFGQRWDPGRSSLPVFTHMCTECTCRIKGCHRPQHSSGMELVSGQQMQETVRRAATVAGEQTQARAEAKLEMVEAAYQDGALGEPLPPLFLGSDVEVECLRNMLRCKLSGLARTLTRLGCGSSERTLRSGSQYPAPALTSTNVTCSSSAARFLLNHEPSCH